MTESRYGESREAILSAALPVRPCREPRCPELVDKGYCTAHSRDKRVDRPSSTRHLYRSIRWKRRSSAFLVNYPFCSCQCGHLATEVDHVKPVGFPDSPSFWDENNWQGLTHQCHSRKTRSDIATRRYQYPRADRSG